MWRRRKWDDDTNGKECGGEENGMTILTVNECGGEENGMTILTVKNVAEEKMG